jgi:hypothetical protein
MSQNSPYFCRWEQHFSTFILIPVVSPLFFLIYHLGIVKGNTTGAEGGDVESS